jgi:predicted peptidase
MLSSSLAAAVLVLVSADQRPPLVRAATVEDFEPRTFIAKGGVVLPYRLFVPRGYEATRKYPLILFLHGAGERGEDNRRQLAFGVLPWAAPDLQAAHPALVVAPQCPEGARWVDTPWEKGSYSIDAVPISRPLAAAVELLAALRKEFSVDAHRILLTGLSMGGYGTWDAALRFPDIFAGAIPICGAGDPSHARRLKRVPIWAFHGGADPLVPVAGSRAMVKALRAAGGPVMYTEVPGVGHNVWDQVYVDPKVLGWLLAQRRP